METLERFCLGSLGSSPSNNIFSSFKMCISDHRVEQTDVAGGEHVEPFGAQGGLTQ